MASYGEYGKIFFKFVIYSLRCGHHGFQLLVPLKKFDKFVLMTIKQNYNSTN